MRGWFQEKQVLELEGNVDKQVVEMPVVDTNVVEEDMTYSRNILGSAVEDVSDQRILGTLWNYHNDNLVFDFTNTASLAESRAYKEKRDQHSL